MVERWTRRLIAVIFHLLFDLAAAPCPYCTFELQTPYLFYGMRVQSAGIGLKLAAASEYACSMLCVGANVAQLETCYAAQFNPSSRLCELVTQDGEMQLVNDTNTVTYIFAPQPSMFLPLSQTCYTSYLDNYGTGGRTAKVSIVGQTARLTSPYAYLNNTILFDASNAFPAFPAVTVTDSAQGRSLDMFNGSFTFSFFLKMYAPFAQDVPVIEFLGSATGQLCAATRISCNGTCLSLLANSNCSCSTPFESLKVNAPFTTHWTHVAIAQNVRTNTTTYYLNGVAFHRVNSIAKAYSIGITRLRIGTSECNVYTNGFNSFSGSLACIQLYKTALTDVQIWTLYKQCYATSV